MIATALLAAATFLTAGGQSAFAESRDKGEVTVEVTDGVEPGAPPVPSPSGPPSDPPGAPGNSGPPKSSGSAQVTQATILDPAAADGALGDDAVSTGGMLFMSGLTVDAAPSFDAGNGELTLSFVIRNTSRNPIDVSADFWVINLFGVELAEVADVNVAALEPNETRRVLVSVDGLGQQLVLRNYVRLTPPQMVDGVALSTMTRNKAIVVPPLLALSLLSGVGALGGLAWWATSARGLGLRLRKLTL